MLAWFAGEQWRLDTFAEGGDIYCASASKMFGIPVVKHGVNGHLRQKGKIAELALGYGGAVGALTSMGAMGYGTSGGRTAAAGKPVEKFQPPYHKVLVGGGHSGSKGREGADGGANGKTVLYLPIRHLICHPPLWPETLLHQAPDNTEPLRKGEPLLRRCRGKQKMDED